MTRLLARLGLVPVGYLLLAPSAHATFPRQNGKIVFTVFLGDKSRFDSRGNRVGDRRARSVSGPHPLKHTPALRVEI